jgi:hypothetical protein
MAKRKTNRSKTEKTQGKHAVNKEQQAPAVLPQDAFDNAILSWFAPEFLRFKKGVIWYALAGLFNALMLAYAIWSQSYTMVAVFVLLPLVFLLDQRHKPEVVEVKVSQFGIRFGAIRVPYSDMKGFWILHEPPFVDELHILVKNRSNPEVTIPLVGTDPTLLRQYLVTQIPEWEGKRQSILDVITRFIKLD